MDFIPALDKVSYPIDGNRGAAIGHKEDFHGVIIYVIAV